MTPEQKIKKEIKQYLRLYGWFVFHIHSQSKYAYPGISDLIAIKDGVTLFLEVKTDKGVLSSAQIEFRNNVESHGGKYFIVRSIEDVQNIYWWN